MISYGSTIKEPNNTVIWDQNGYLLFEIDRYGEVLTCFETVLRLDTIDICSNLKDVWYGKGYVFFAQGIYDNALACCEKALTIDPSYSHAKELQKMILDLKKDK